MPMLWMKFQQINKKSFLDILPLAFLMFAITAAQFYALQLLSATIVITILTTTPAFVAVIDSLRQKAVLAKSFWPGFFLCFVGIVLTLDPSGFLSANSPEGALKGLLLTFLAVAMSTTYRTKLGSVTERVPSLTISSVIFVICGIFSLICLPFAGKISGIGWLYGFVIGIFAVLANITFVKAIALLGAARMSVISMLQRPFVIFLASILLQEPLSVLQICGILMVASGIYFAKVEKK